MRIWLAPIVEAAGDGKRFRAKHHLGDCPVILFVARKSRAKGFHQMRQAMESVVAAVPNVCLVAVGPDTEPPFPPVAGKYLDLSIASDAERADALAACDVYCMPSNADAFGLVSYGKPVICGPAPGSVELINRGEGGIATTQETPAIAEALKKLLTKSELARALGANGKRFVDENLTWAKIVDQHIQLFESAVRSQ